MTVESPGSRVFVPLSTLSVRAPAVDVDAADTQPESGLTPLERRMRMLLVDGVDGQPYVFDPESADITFVSDRVAEVLLACQSGAEQPPELLQTVADMLELPEPDTRVRTGGWGLKLHLNHSCNLACEYCYADGRTSDLDGHAKGAYGGPVSFMQPETIERAVSAFAAEAPGDQITIIFFGGEPLLSERRFLDAVELVTTVAARHGKRVQFTMTTNATLLTEPILDCLVENSFRVAVSVDGTKDTHDRQRPTAQGKGSYDRVVQGLSRLTARGVPAAVRMTAFRGRPGLVEDHRSLADLPAVTTTFQFSFYGEDARRPMERDERDELFEHYHTVAAAVLAGDRAAGRLGTVSDTVASIVLKRKKQFQCGAGREFWAVAAGGDVYPCHRFVGMTAYKVGNVADADFGFRSLGMFAANSVENRVVKSDGRNNCGICFAHNVCGGGCAQVAAANTGRVGELPPFYCQDTRLRVQAAVRAIVESTRAPQPA